MKVGDKFRMFKKGRVCKIVAIENGKVKFETVQTNPIQGSFPVSQASAHIKGK